jgi:CBS domain-containing protein
MKRELITVTPETTTQAAILLMKERRIGRPRGEGRTAHRNRYRATSWTSRASPEEKPGNSAPFVRRTMNQRRFEMSAAAAGFVSRPLEPNEI